MDIVVILLNFMYSHNFHYQLVNSVTLLLFVVKKIIYQCMLIIEGKKILALGEETVDDLDDSSITQKCKYILKIIKSRKKINFSLHYNAGNSFLYADCMKI